MDPYQSNKNDHESVEYSNRTPSSNIYEKRSYSIDQTGKYTVSNQNNQVTSIYKTSKNLTLDLDSNVDTIFNKGSRTGSKPIINVGASEAVRYTPKIKDYQTGSISKSTPFFQNF